MTPSAANPHAGEAESAPWLRHVVRAGGIVAVSGQVARDWETGANFVDSVGQETRYILDRISQLLGSQGCAMTDVVKVTAYLTDLGRFAEFNEVYREFFPTNPPTRTAIEVSALAQPYSVEIDALAVCPSDEPDAGRPSSATAGS